MPRRQPVSRKPARSAATRWPRWLVWLLRLALLGLVLLSVWLVWLDAQVRARFDGNKWTLPAKVYARPLTLYPGRLLSPEQLSAELQWADYRAVSDTGRAGTYRREGLVFSIHRRAFPFWDGPEPARRLAVRLQDNRVAEIRENGESLPIVRLEPQYIGGIFPAHNEDRQLVRLEDVPPALVAALIVTEDKAFFDHFGISLRGIARALVANLQAGGVVQGGSTLTQQLVKNFFLSSDRTLIRKGQEALMALLLELHYSKEEILQAYLNEVYLGQAGRRAIHGFGLASRFYFGKPLNELDHAEIATLVGLVKGASYYNPRRNPQRSKERRDLVLALMENQQIITSAERIRAQAQPLQTADANRAGQREYPAFLELARAQLQRDYRLEDLQSEGLHIFTTLDPWAQHAVEGAAAAHLQRLEQRHPQQRGQLQAAAVITSVDGGEVRALLGGREAEFFGFNRALNARRAIGSLSKPVVFLAALDSGRWHWGTLIEDKEVTVSGPGGQLWQPQNYNRRSYGPVPLVDSLALSLNQSTARLGMNVGLSKVADTFRRLGLEDEVPPYPSMLLGAIPMSPLQVAGLYQSIASQGFVMPLRSIEAVTDLQGQTLSSYGLRGEQRFDASLMRWLRWGLEQVAERGTAKALAPALSLPLAAKTGTSNDQRDAWFAGFDNQHVGVVWVGRDDNEPMPFAGSGAALPVWRDAFVKMGSEPLPAIPWSWITVDNLGRVQGEGCGGARYPMPASRMPAGVTPCVSAPAADHPTKEKRSWFDWLF